MFGLEVLQRLETRSCLVSMLTNYHALYPQRKGVPAILAITIQYAISGDAGDKQSKGLCSVGDFGNVDIPMAMFVELA